MAMTRDRLRTADLRPMPFGRTDSKHVKDGLWEPLWSGRRGLVEIQGDVVTAFDDAGEPLETGPELAAALAGASLATELVVDGYFLPTPFRPSAGAEALPGMDAAPSPGQMGRQMFMGSRGSNEARRDELEAEQDRQRRGPDLPAAFVAVDLLWLDSESLLDVPLLERKRVLESVLLDGEQVRRTMAVRPPVEVWFGQWRALGFREIAVKGANSRYTPGQPSGDWATALIPRR